MIKFELRGTTAPIWINPKYILSVDGIARTNKFCTITLIDTRKYAVRGTVTDVVEKINRSLVNG